MHKAPLLHILCAIATILSLSSCSSKVLQKSEQKLEAPEPIVVATQESDFLTNIRQLTFLGRRAGEGYFSADGKSMIFQSERLEENPFYQMYLLDFQSGTSSRVSPGNGKTTCGWVHPTNKRVLFSSTHEDPQSKLLQAKELEFRKSGKTKRYSWDYDEAYEIYSKGMPSGLLWQLTDVRGYDAEGSYSPDGTRIVFASNRRAYSETLSAEEQVIFAKDKSYFIDLYSMAADGSDVQQLTTSAGYDGGPFYSADGRFITWRRFNKEGTTAEIYVMNADGSEQRQVTSLGAMSWAPFFHPSGDYLLFATNVHGFGNFELYLSRVDGEGKPVRVTTTDGFDGLPVFSPDGTTVSWTTKRGYGDGAQIFLAEWNDANARRLLGLPVPPPEPYELTIAANSDLLKTLVYKYSDESLQGRRTGTEGERRATALAAADLSAHGLLPIGENESYFQEFEFTSGVALGEQNSLKVLRADSNWQNVSAAGTWTPLSFSKTGRIDAAGVVFAGYGIKAPATNSTSEYDSYVHTNVKDKWVLVFRGIPTGVDKDLHTHLARHSSPRYKAMIARDLGAKGLLFVRGPESKMQRELLPLRFDQSQASTSLAALSVSDAFASSLFPRPMAKLQERLNAGEAQLGFELPGVKLYAEIDIREETKVGRNVLALLPANEEFTDTAKTIVVGAHIDHLGVGENGSSLARSDEKSNIHLGADDNASGVSAAITIARNIAASAKRGGIKLKHNLLIGLWSGEEMGLLGSSHFAKTLKDSSLGVAAYINMDMIGRLREALVLQGISSSPDWLPIIETQNSAHELALTLQNDSYLPTDATSFYLAGVPILSAFTGAHSEYHTPRDTPDTLNYNGLARITNFLTSVTSTLLSRETAPSYAKTKRPEEVGRRANLRAYLGTIPDYAGNDTQGVRLSGISAGAPAESAGLQSQDIIVELDGRNIENIYDYTYAIEALKIGEEVSISVLRGNKTLRLRILPGSRN